MLVGYKSYLNCSKICQVSGIGTHAESKLILHLAYYDITLGYLWDYSSDQLYVSKNRTQPISANNQNSIIFYTPKWPGEATHNTIIFCIYRLFSKINDGRIAHFVANPSWEAALLCCLWLWVVIKFTTFRLGCTYIASSVFFGLIFFSIHMHANVIVASLQSKYQNSNTRITFE